MARRRKAWDIALSIVLMALAVVTALIGSFSQLFVLAFTDYCPPASCHIDQAVAGVGVTWAIVAAVLIASIVITIVLLVRRRRGWWVALVGLLVVIAGTILSLVVYALNVGYSS